MYKDQDYESTVVLWKTYSFPRESLARAIVSFFTERRFAHPHLQKKSITTNHVFWSKSTIIFGINAWLVYIFSPDIQVQLPKCGQPSVFLHTNRYLVSLVSVSFLFSWLSVVVFSFPTTIPSRSNASHFGPTNNKFSVFLYTSHFSVAMGPRRPVLFLEAYYLFSRKLATSMRRVTALKCAVLLCILSFWVPCCDVLPFLHKTMFGSSLPPVVWRKTHVLFTLFVFVCI